MAAETEHIREFTTSGSFVIPNAPQLYIEVIGGGGGGGGGAGGRLELYLDIGSEVAAGDVINYKVGQGGSPGQDGTTSQVTFGNYQLVAEGGVGGKNGTVNQGGRQGQGGDIIITAPTNREEAELLDRARHFGSMYGESGGPGSDNGIGGFGGNDRYSGGDMARYTFGQLTPAQPGQSGSLNGSGGGGGGGGAAEMAAFQNSPHLPSTQGAMGGQGAPGVIRLRW